MGYGDNRYGDDRGRGRGEGGGRWERERSSYGDWGSDRERSERHRGGGDDDRGFFERAGDEMRSWFSDDDDRGDRSQERGRSGGEQRGGQGSDWGRGGASFGGGFGNQRGWGDDHFDRQFGSERGGYGGDRTQGRPDRDRSQERYDEQSGPTGGRSSYGGGGGGAEPWAGSGFGGPDDNGRRFDRIDPGHVGAQGAHPMSSPVDGGYGGGYGISAGGGAGSSAARYAAMGGRGGQRHIDTAKLLGDDRGGGRQGGRQGGGFGGGHHDPHYSEWRQRQIESLDRDYEDYRREHQSRFEQEFGGWREKRQTQRQHLARVTEQMEVVGSDGERIGTVDKVRGDRIILTKNGPNAGGVHHMIPCSWVDSVDERVTVNKSAKEAMAQWQSEEQNRALFERGDEGSEGPHMLNRSFSGTYDKGDSDR